MPADQLPLLNPDEFGEASSTRASAGEEVRQPRREYDDIGYAQKHGNMTANPIHDYAASAIAWSGEVSPDPDPGQRFVPTERIVSSQAQVSRAAIDRLVQGSSGFDTPDVQVREGIGEHAGTFALRDGNHRVNAALQRGQLLVPAEVYRTRSP